MARRPRLPRRLPPRARGRTPAAFFYETPPVARDTLDRPYEHVITDAPALVSLPPEPHPFREHLADARARGPVAVFLNLGGDATLVAPVDDASASSASACAHLADFVRGADADARHALLRAMAEVVEARVGGLADVGVHERRGGIVVTRPDRSSAPVLRPRTVPEIPIERADDGPRARSFAAECSTRAMLYVRTK